MDSSENVSKAKRVISDIRDFLDGSSQGLLQRNSDQAKSYMLDELDNLINKLKNQYRDIQGWE